MSYVEKNSRYKNNYLHKSLQRENINSIRRKQEVIRALIRQLQQTHTDYI